MNLILSPKDWTGDVPVLAFNGSLNGLSQIVQTAAEFLELAKHQDSVFVAFYTMHEEEHEEEHDRFLVTKKWHILYEFLDNVVDDVSYENIKSLNFFEFPTYKEAFEYCIELKEGL